MFNALQITNGFIENNTDFSSLISELRIGFSANEIIVPQRHHHDFPNPEANTTSTLLLMPAWNPSKEAGVKVITVSPENGQYNLPSIQGTYIYLDAAKGDVKALIEAKNLTAKRTAATSALASFYLSRKNSKSLLMIGTGELSVNLIKAHASIRPIEQVYIWGRNFDKALAICKKFSETTQFSIEAINHIKEKISEVDIISCATLSKTPLIFGKFLKKGQHIDLVGAYKKDMREADDMTITKASIFIDSFQSGLEESGDIAIPIKHGILNPSDIKADLFDLCSNLKKGRTHESEITVFKSVGHALEDLVAAKYYYNKISNE